MKAIRVHPTICLCLAPFLAACRNGAPEQVRLETMRVAGHPIRVEIADTPETRRQGLMYRESLADDRGMLFVFPKEEVLGFWMKNTRIPLSIAFISKEGRIVRIAEMKPFSEESHSSGVPVRFALEMNRGWFRERGIQPGDRVELPAGVNGASPQPP